MRGVYTASYKISAISTARTVMYITAPAAAVVEVLEASVTNDSSSTSQQIEVAMQTIGTLGTPTATSVTPAKSEAGDQASGSTVKGNVTASEPTYTASTEWGYEGANVLSGWFHQPIPEDRRYVAPGGSLGIRLLSTPNPTFDCQVRLVWREIG